jgi:ribosomal protein L24
MYTPAGKKFMEQVLKINPDYDASMYANRAPTRRAFTSGPQGQAINAMNAAVGHIAQLTGAIEALDSGDVQAKNAAYNWLKTQFGNDAVSNFETLRQTIAGEISTILNRGQATVSGIAETEKNVKTSGSPRQMAGYIKTQIPIIGSKLAAYDYQYHQAMGEKDPFSALSPDTKTILSGLGYDPLHPEKGPQAKKEELPPVSAFAGKPAGNYPVTSPSGKQIMIRWDGKTVSQVGG